jgi:hypothetical protein
MRQQKQQKGVVLIVSLILLVLVTLISVSSMKNTVLEEKMAGNYKDKTLHFRLVKLLYEKVKVTYLTRLPYLSLMAPQRGYINRQPQVQLDGTRSTGIARVER